jgi:hypothetical protein
MDAFKTAVFIFWLSWFANQRGCLPKFRSALLAQLISTATGDTLAWFVEHGKECEAAWNKIHNTILKVFVDRVEQICDAWLCSSAGTYYRGLIKTARYVLKQLDKANSKQFRQETQSRTH